MIFNQCTYNCFAATLFQRNDFEKFCDSLTWDDHADAMAATLVVPANSSKVHSPMLNDPSTIFSDTNDRPKSKHESATSNFPRATPLHGASPFPVLEAYIIGTLGKRGGGVGCISTWSIGTQRPLPRTVCFNMKDNRYCDNVRRAHKSNNIIWNVHLGDRICWQSCHDPECRGYRGEPIDLPEEVNIEIDEYFLEYELSLLIEDDAIRSIQDEQATSERAGDFGDSTLKSAIRQLDHFHFGKKSGNTTQTFDDDESLDNELAELNLSELVARSRVIIGSQNQYSNGASPPTRNETSAEYASNIRNENLSEFWKNDDDLDLELAMLNLSDLGSI